MIDDIPPDEAEVHDCLRRAASRVAGPRRHEVDAVLTALTSQPGQRQKSMRRWYAGLAAATATAAALAAIVVINWSNSDGDSTAEDTPSLTSVGATESTDIVAGPPPVTSPEPSSANVRLADRAYTRLAAWLAERDGIVYTDETSLDIGACPVLDGDTLDAVLTASAIEGIVEPAGAAYPTGWAIVGDTGLPDEGGVIDPIGLRCDFDRAGALFDVDYVDLLVLDDQRLDGMVTSFIDSFVEAGAFFATERSVPARLPGRSFSGCVGDVDNGECLEGWVSGDLVVILYVGMASAPESSPFQSAFDFVLPSIVERIAELP